MEKVLKTVQRGAQTLGRAAKLGHGSASRGSIIGHVDGYDNYRVRGWALDKNDLKQPLEISITVRGTEIANSHAGKTRLDLSEIAKGHCDHGYEFYVDLAEVKHFSDVVFKARNPQSGDFSDLAITLKVRNALKASLETNSREALRLQSIHQLILIDIQDIMEFLKDHNGVTGIQRVVGGIVQTLLLDQTRSKDFVFCQIASAQGRARIFDSFAVLSLVSRAMEGETAQNVLREQVADIREKAFSYELKDDDVYFIAGAYWVVPDFAPRLNALKQRGVVIGTYIYDLIPITAPEWVTDGTRDAVTDRAIDILFLSDFFLTISEFVADEVRALLELELGQAKPVIAVKLPHALPSRKLNDSPIRNSVVVSQPFVLAVGTLEGRKNHLLLFRIWSALIRKRGADNVPLLILVGRWGWNVDRFRHAVESTGALRGKIKIFNDLGDRELAYLYQNCMFTTFASFVEGWGLPVGESLTAGKYCLCSNTTSIPEVGGSFCGYFDPHDYLSSFRIFDETIFDVGALLEKTTRIKKEFKPREWNEFAEELLNRIKSTGTKSPSLIPLLRSLELRKMTWDALVTDQSISWNGRTFKFARVNGWHELEPWGVWATSSRAEIRFNTGLSSRTIIVMCQMRLPPHLPSCPIELSGSASADLVISEHPAWSYFEATTNTEGNVNLVFKSNHLPLEESNRFIFIGLMAIVYCERQRSSLLDLPVELLEKAGVIGGLAYSRDDQQPVSYANVF